MSTPTCPYCGEPSVSRITCPGSGEYCEWCCDACMARQCSRGVLKSSYPAAEQVSRYAVELGEGATLEQAVLEWSVLYTARTGVVPGEAETEAARAVLEQRFDSACPPPPSASTSSTHHPKLTIIQWDT